MGTVHPSVWSDFPESSGCFVLLPRYLSSAFLLSQVRLGTVLPLGDELIASHPLRPPSRDVLSLAELRPATEGLLIDQYQHLVRGAPFFVEQDERIALLQPCQRQLVVLLRPDLPITAKIDAVQPD